MHVIKIKALDPTVTASAENCHAAAASQQSFRSNSCVVNRTSHAAEFFVPGRVVPASSLVRMSTIGYGNARSLVFRSGVCDCPFSGIHLAAPALGLDRKLVRLLQLGLDLY